METLGLDARMSSLLVLSMEESAREIREKRESKLILSIPIFINVEHP